MHVAEVCEPCQEEEGWEGRGREYTMLVKEKERGPREGGLASARWWLLFGRLLARSRRVAILHQDNN